MLKQRDRFRAPLSIIVVAMVVATLTACGEKETTYKPAETTVAEEQETTVDAAIDQLTLPFEIRIALLDELGVDGLRIETMLENGQVSLSGVVNDPASQLDAEAVVSEIDGVADVNNTIVVAPSEDHRPDTKTAEELKLELADELLEAEVKMRLFAAIGADASQIDVESTNGTVSLSGAVDEAREKTESVAAAEAALGVVEVLDFIQVADPIIVEEDH